MTESAPDMKWKEYGSLVQGLSDARRVVFAPRLYDHIRARTLQSQRVQAGDFLFGHDDGTYLDIDEAEAIVGNAWETSIDVDMDHFRDVVRERGRDGLEYLGFWKHHPDPAEQPRIPKDFGYESVHDELSLVRHPFTHTPERIYTIGISGVPDRRFYYFSGQSRAMAKEQGESYLAGFDPQACTVDLYVYLARAFDQPRRLLIPGERHVWRGFRRKTYPQMRSGFVSKPNVLHLDKRTL